ncbi:MAG: hypothetical protein ACO3S8_08330 [Aquiluna sp.]
MVSSTRMNTPEMRKKVRMLAVAGYSNKEISEILDLDVKGLESQFSKEIRESRAETVSAVASTLVRQALAGNVQCMMFYLKTQGGWKEAAPVKEQVDNKPVYQLYSAPLKSRGETIEYIRAKQAAMAGAEQARDAEVEVVVDEEGSE